MACGGQSAKISSGRDPRNMVADTPLGPVWIPDIPPAGVPPSQYAPAAIEDAYTLEVTGSLDPGSGYGYTWYAAPIRFVAPIRRLDRDARMPRPSLRMLGWGRFLQLDTLSKSGIA